jgi:N,N'-diacetyllegionaminate synthase
MVNRVLIIAEAGVNHNGDINIAKKLVDAAVEAGADIIKFQTYKTENLVTSNAEQAEYQIINSNKKDNSQFEMLKRLELSEDKFIELQAYCKMKNITFLSTPFDLESIDFLNKIELPFWKIPSGEITNYPYLLKIARTKKPVVLSTGMCTVQDIELAIDVLNKNGSEDIKILHCNTQYPTPLEDVNLYAIDFLRERLQKEVGYSDHTQGIEVALAAVALGATIIEKHFTLDRNMEGPDHKASLEPHELKQMIFLIRNIEVSLGSRYKTPTQSEIKNMKIARKSIVAKKCIHIGEMFTEDNITTKRPGTGINPMHWESVIGKIATKEFKEDEMITL